MPENESLVRLQKYIADCGVASRRKAEELILHNKVMVNKTVINQLGYKVHPENDIVSIDGKIIKPESKKVYIMLNKPIGYVTTVKDQFNRPTVIDLLIDIEYRVFPVGRLDYDTSGLLLLTNDGDLANKIMHPRYKIDKAYIANVSGYPTEKELEKLRSGIKIDNYYTSPANVKILKMSNNSTSIHITIHEGKNRQVRKMFEAIGYKVVKLNRIALGNIKLNGLKEGHWRYLSSEEVNYLKKL